MGVSGCGKTSIGILLSKRLGWLFYDADDYHSEENKSKMAQGVPLTDDDRRSWLQNLKELIELHLLNCNTMVLACSALRQSYRDFLQNGYSEIQFVFLNGDYDLILERLMKRQDHFMKSNMLLSQFSILEKPTDAISININSPPEKIVEKILISISIDNIH